MKTPMILKSNAKRRYFSEKVILKKASPPFISILIMREAMICFRH